MNRTLKAADLQGLLRWVLPAADWCVPVCLCKGAFITVEGVVWVQVRPSQHPLHSS
jgi:hypothetical protein